MNILGIDYGEKQIGIALSFYSEAHGLMTVYAAEAVARIKQACTKYDVQKIILGLPQGRLVKKITAFGEQLRDELHIPVLFWDETLTSQQANSSMRALGTGKKKRTEKEHQLSAAFILQTYLDTARNESFSPK